MDILTLKLLEKYLSLNSIRYIHEFIKYDNLYIYIIVFLDYMNLLQNRS